VNPSAPPWTGGPPTCRPLPELGRRWTFGFPDDDQCFPGNPDVTVSCLIDRNNELTFSCTAVTDAATLVNLTDHAYFHLGGEGTGDILGHEPAVDADPYTPVGEDLIPCGDHRPVTGTPRGSSTAPSSGRAVRRTGRARVSRWRPSTSPTPRTGPVTPPRCCGPRRSTGRGRSCGSASAVDPGGGVPNPGL
jgi:hypothetical protein